MRVRRNRSVREWTDRDGAAVMQVSTTPAAMANIRQAVQALPAAQAALPADERSATRFEAVLADAAELMALRSLGRDDDGGEAPSAKKVIVRVDHAALVRDHNIDGEVCEIAGVGPITEAEATDMMRDAFLAAIVTKGHDVLTVAHLGRKPRGWTAYGGSTSG